MQQPNELEAGETEDQSASDRAYGILRERLIWFREVPEARLREAELAEQLHMSRTPVREALARLVVDGLATFSPRQGFSCRRLCPSITFNLFEMRQQLETGSIALALSRGTPAHFIRLHEIANDLGQPSDDPGRAVMLVENFHETIIGAASNREMFRVVQNIHARIRYVSSIELTEARVSATAAALSKIAESMSEGDVVRSTALVYVHLGRLKTDVIDTVREGFGRIFTRREQSDVGNEGTIHV